MFLDEFRDEFFEFSHKSEKYKPLIMSYEFDLTYLIFEWSNSSSV